MNWNANSYLKIDYVMVTVMNFSKTWTSREIAVGVEDYWISKESESQSGKPKMTNAKVIFDVEVFF